MSPSPHRTNLPPALPGELQRQLRAYVRGRAAWTALAEATLGLVTAGLVAVAACVVDRLADIPGLWRLPLTLASASLAAVFFARALWQGFRPADYDEAAHALDRAHGDHRDHLRSALDFARSDLGGHPFAALTLQQADKMWSPVRSTRYVDRRGAVRRLLALGALAVLAAVPASLPSVRAALLWQRFLHPLGNHMRPTASWFDVDPPAATPLKGGDDYRIRARLRGRPVAHPTPMVKIAYADGRSLIRKLDAAEDGSWQTHLNDVRHDFTYVVWMEPARSAVYSVRILPRPSLSRVTVSYDFPKYTGLKKRTEELSGRTITALEGTKLRIDLACSLPLREATGTLGDETRRFMIGAPNTDHATSYLFMEQNRRMDLRLVATNGLESLREPPLQLRVIADAPPTISIAGQWAQREMYLSEVLQIGYKAQDDLGLAEVVLRCGSFEQEAELPVYGGKEAQGTLQIPLAILAEPGKTSVKFRMVARDGKGQAAASPEVTVRLAVNSYDRQLRLARNSFVGKPDLRDLSTCGFASLSRAQTRLAALKALEGKVTLLKETLNERTKPGAGDQPCVNAIHASLATLEPSFDALRVPWNGQLFDWLSGMALTPRLQTVVRDAVCGAELALNTSALSRSLQGALDSDNPKVALDALTPMLASALKTQTELVDHLNASYRALQVELAGYLAESLEARLERATPTDWGNHDFVLSARSEAAELADLVSTSLGGIAGSASNEFRLALSAKDPRQALEQLRPLLQPLATNLVAAALASESSPLTPPLPVAAYAESARSASPAWVNVHALWLVMQSGSPRSDAIARLQDSLRFLHSYGAGDGSFPPVGDGNASVRESQEAAWRAYATLARMRADAESVQVGLSAGYISAGTPEFETLWIALREGYLDLLRLQRQPALDAGIRRDMETLTAGKLLPLQHWVSPERDRARLGATVGEWEESLGNLALRLSPSAHATLRVFDADLSTRWPALQAGAAALSRDVAGRIADLEKWHTGSGQMGLDALYGPVWSLETRLRAFEQAVLTMLDVGEACRLHGDGASTDLERLSLAETYLRKANEFLESSLLDNRSLDGRGAHFKGTLMDGKIKDYREFDRIIGEVAAVVAAPQPPEEVARRLKDNMVSVSFERARGQLRAALAMEAALGDRTDLVRTLAGDRTAAAAVWGPVCHEVIRIQQALGEGQNLEFAKARAAATLRLLQLLDPLPKDVQPLPDALSGCTGDLSRPERRKALADGLDGLLDDLRPLAEPPPAAQGKEQSQADLLGVNRARIMLAAGGPDLPRLPLRWAVTELEWNRRKVRAAEGRLAVGGLALSANDDLANLKLPKHLYLELKRAREQAVPVLFKDRCYQYLNTIMDQAR